MPGLLQLGQMTAALPEVVKVMDQFIFDLPTFGATLRPTNQNGRNSMITGLS
jgi:hypothetical protein